MKRYFFHIADNPRERDQDGTELPDLASARREAARFAGSLLTEAPELIEGENGVRVQVTDSEERLLFTVVALTVDEPMQGLAASQFQLGAG